MKRCAIYTRSATEGAARCEVQRDLCIQAALRQGWTVLSERFDDPLCTGGWAEREGLRRLIERAATRSFDVVLVWRASRLSRNLLHLSILLETFNSLGVELVSVSEPAIVTQLRYFEARLAGDVSPPMA
jgi:DNA invertase Pin-like site-specific DNA recombinase